jgi:hypothetical protein
MAFKRPLALYSGKIKELAATDNIYGIIIKSLLNNATTTIATNTDTSLSVPVLANEVWVLEFYGTAQCSSTGGSKYQVSAPTGSVVEGFLQGTTTSANTPSNQRISAINTLNSTVLHTVATTPAPDTILVRVKVGATAGNIAIGFASGVAAQTTTIFAGAFIRAYKTVEV